MEGKPTGLPISASGDVANGVLLISRVLPEPLVPAPPCGVTQPLALWSHGGLHPVVCNSLVSLWPRVPWPRSTTEAVGRKEDTEFFPQ